MTTGDSTLMLPAFRRSDDAMPGDAVTPPGREEMRSDPADSIDVREEDDPTTNGVEIPMFPEEKMPPLPRPMRPNEELITRSENPVTFTIPSPMTSNPVSMLNRPPEVTVVGAAATDEFPNDSSPDTIFTSARLFPTSSAALSPSDRSPVPPIVPFPEKPIDE
jgi:hypothetical protein